MLHETFGITQGVDDDRPLLHQRSAAARSAAQGSAARPRGGAVDHPDHDGRRARRWAKCCRRSRDAGRDRDARADAERLGRRSRACSSTRRRSKEEVNAAFKSAADGKLKGILEYTDEQLVSVDFRGNPHSSILDSAYTAVMDGDFVKVLSWYDNEWGYSSRCVDLLRYPRQEGAVALARSIKDLDLAGKRVFIRVDFNVPIKNGTISDDTRIRASLPTIQYALEQGATVILASHLGRPKGKPNPEYSLRPVAARLSELLGRPVEFAERLHRRAGQGGDRTAQRTAARSSCSRICASIRKRKRTTAGSPKQLASLAESTSTMRSGRRTARTRRPRGSSTT